MARESEKADIDRIKRDVELAEEAHKEWWNKLGLCKLAYRYKETRQEPENFPKDKIYATINRVRETHDSEMNFFTGAKQEIVVQGAGRFFKDRERTKLVKRTMEWVAEESGLMMENEWVLEDHRLIGQGWNRMAWDPYKDTSMKTKGMLKPRWIDPEYVMLDPDARDRFGLSGRFLVYKPPAMTREAFEDEFEDLIAEKNIDVDRVFEEAGRQGHWDYDINASVTDKKLRRATPVQYEYWFRKKVPLRDPFTGEPILDKNGKPVIIPYREARIALAAGDRILTERKSPLADLELWTFLGLMNSRLKNSPYGQSNFPSEKEMQDLLNVGVSLQYNALARQLYDILFALKGLVDTEKLRKDLESIGPVIHEIDWDEHSPIPVQLISKIVQRFPQGQLNQGINQLTNWIFEAYSRVSTRDIVQGINEPGVTSGRHAQVLQAGGLQPINYQKNKLKAPMANLGRAGWALTRINLTGEMELPTKNTSGEPEGLTINEFIPAGRMAELFTAASSEDSQAGEKANEELQMITVRKGNERLTLEEFITGRGAAAVDLFKAEAEQPGRTNREGENGAPEFIKNDITFGYFDVKVTIDMMAEQSKLEREQRAMVFMPMIEKAAGSLAALEFGLDAVDYPNKEELIKNFKEQNQVMQMAQHLVKNPEILQMAQMLAAQQEGGGEGGNV